MVVAEAAKFSPDPKVISLLRLVIFISYRPLIFMSLMSDIEQMVSATLPRRPIYPFLNTRNYTLHYKFHMKQRCPI